jgi:hypothetical protein
MIIDKVEVDERYPSEKASQAAPQVSICLVVPERGVDEK